ncbi:Capsule polysaccharide biosynthesis protein [Rhizobium sp. CF080]|uniref:glycosyltransferase family 29 protein n=1 Tax=Rhizobium sp. (strain CF080) TaxID=1144310 RepID=UPI0002719A3A|nr:glycosyltransferase family 29 protein [Rhizobium sp. CF080]EUB96539.1 Capsule polysaccharide biosynthesis protein [Rhizobium sp. CF080]
MNIRQVSRERNDLHFWQILVVCTAKEFENDGEDLVRSMEINSPDTRIIVCLVDADASARERLSGLAAKLLSVTLYELELSRSSSPLALQRYIIAKNVLALTKIPTLLLDVGSLVYRDLTPLPAELQKCDCALKLTFNKKKRWERVFPKSLWLAPNTRTGCFLEEVISHLQSCTGGDITEKDERRALYSSLQNCRSFIRLAALPGKYADRSHKSGAYIFSPLDPDKKEGPRTAEIRRKLRDRFEQPPTQVIFFPKQDVGTKRNLKNNSFKRRVDRISRPGRMYWRHMSQLIAKLADAEGENTRIVALPQWEINAAAVNTFAEASAVYLPHMIRRQLGGTNTLYYMQELLPDLFTADADGWGASSSLYGRKDFEAHQLDDRVEDFIAKIRKERITKAPQKKASSKDLSEIELLAPLQVPGDDALIYHGAVTLEDYVETLATFAEREKTNVVFRKHPYDETSLFEDSRKQYSSNFVKFSVGGHIHDALAKAKAVAIINSGVGFEAMIYNRPVLSFGRSIYDSAVINANRQNFSASYAKAIEENEDIRWERYLRFISWYVFHAGYKLHEEKINLELDRTAPPKWGENPIYDNLALDETAAWRGVNLQKAPAGYPLKELRAQARYLIRRLQKTAGIYKRRIKKRSFDHLSSGVKAPWISRFDEGYLRGKTVALVGNASSLKQTNLGSEIDAHDIVIRMNLGYPLTVSKTPQGTHLPPEFIHGTFLDGKSSGAEQLVLLKPDTPEDVANAFTSVAATGRRTDIWSCSTSDRERQLFYAPLFDCRTVACHPAFEHLSPWLILNRKIFKLPAFIYRELRDEFSIEPTSGLIWIDYLRRTQLASLTIYGFDFFASGHIVRRMPNLLQAEGKWPHDPQAERDYVFEKALAKDARIRLVSSVSNSDPSIVT